MDRFLQEMTEEAFRKLCFSIDPEEYNYPMDEEDSGYTWEYLLDSRPFRHSAAERGLWVLFDVDQ